MLHLPHLYLMKFTLSKKGINHDIMLYPIFRDDRQHDSWYDETHAISSIHSTETVFNPHYSPTETFQALFWVEIKWFMFSVFCKNIQTSAGCMLIKCHSDSSNAQFITKELPNHWENSIYAETPAHVNPDNLCIGIWKGTLQAFLNHWDSQ